MTKVLVTTHAQMFQTPDGKVWTNSVYDYNFFKRYLNVFESVRIMTRMKKIDFKEINNKILVNGERLEFYSLPHYHGPWEYAKKYFRIKKEFSNALETCDCAILRIPDQTSFSLFKEIKDKGIPCAIEVVAHSWDLFAPGTMKTKLRPYLRLLWDYNQKKICREATGVSYVTSDYIQKRYPTMIKNNEDKRFQTNYTSADLDEAFFGQPRKKEWFQKEKLNFVHVSGINNNAKGHNELINVMFDLKKMGYSHTLTFIGGGTLLNEFRDKSIDLGLSKEIIFLGHIGKSKDIADVLSKSDVFILPTLTEGLPRAVLEAMANGLPCIATNVGGIPELISSEFLVNSRNEDDLKRKIIEVNQNSSLLEKESYKNFEKIQVSYKPSEIQKKREKFYSKLKKKAVNNYNAY